MGQKKKILITGASGFIGSSLVRFIRKNRLKFDIYGVNEKSKCYGNNFYLCDLNNGRELYKILNNIRPDYIVHLAGGRYGEDKKTFDSNFETTRVLFSAIKKINRYSPRVVIPGTAAEYGKVSSTTKRIDEDYLAQPSSWYGFVKYLQTNLGLMHHRKGHDVVVARMFNILGTGTSATLAIGKFSHEISLIEKGAGPKTIMTQNLSGKRDFLDIDDVCSALIKIAQKGKSGEIYNVCSGKSCTVRSLLRRLLKCSKRKDIKIKENKKSSQQSFDIVGSNKKIKKELKWKPQVSLEQSLKNTLEYYRRINHT